MTTRSLIDELPLDAKTKQRLADVAREKQRTPEELAAAFITTGLADFDDLVEQARLGVADADAGGLGSSHDEMLRYFEQRRDGKRDAQFPEATKAY